MPNPNTRPRPIPSSSSSPTSSRARSLADHTDSRSALNARLASPVPSSVTDHRRGSGNGEMREQGRLISGRTSGTQTPLAGSSENRSSGPRESALSSALAASVGGSSPLRSHMAQNAPNSPNPNLAPHDKQLAPSNYGSFDPSSVRSGRGSPAPYEDFDIVRRHLAGPKKGALSGTPPRFPAAVPSPAPGTVDNNHPSDVLDEEFSSLRMQGGDITREIYRRTEAEQRAKRTQRSKSFNVLRSGSQNEDLDIDNLHQPGGFRRNYLIRHATSPIRRNITNEDGAAQTSNQPNFLTRNFFEFLSLYGHFAGEDVDDSDYEDEDILPDEPESQWQSAEDAPDYFFGSEEQTETNEQRPLLRRATTTKRRTRQDNRPKKGAGGTALLLLKSFVGTGVLFLPRAFLNGGMLFSVLVLLGVALVSYYCFLLLTTSRLVLKGSFAEMGEMVHGKWMRALINTSLVISQIGFASAYIVFTSENLRAFILAVSDCKTAIDIRLMILMQLIVFLPLSLYRNLNNISFVVYIADIFIVLGLIYLYYYGIATMAVHGIADIVLFNRNYWTLFIGTAIFTFEGIGLLIPIQDGMENPQQLPAVLGGVMVIITVIFISMGALSYAAYGSKTETVIILNMPQDNKFVNSVQFLYSLAILLSTPMQIFPAITILEKGVFTKSGKYSKNIKWMKNGFRFLVVMFSAFIAWLGANDLDKFVALVGSFACIPLVFIYPPLIHRKAVATSWWSRSIDILLCIFGLVLMAYTSTLTIKSWVVGSDSGDHSKGYCDR